MRTGALPTSLLGYEVSRHMDQVPTQIVSETVISQRELFQSKRQFLLQVSTLEFLQLVVILAYFDDDRYREVLRYCHLPTDTVLCTCKERYTVSATSRDPNIRIAMTIRSRESKKPPLQNLNRISPINCYSFTPDLRGQLIVWCIDPEPSTLGTTQDRFKVGLTLPRHRDSSQALRPPVLQGTRIRRSGRSHSK